MVKIGEDYYIFGHRHTHGTAFSRQGIAEKIEILEDGTIPQTEMTSCGLNGGPLPAEGRHQTYIACHLTEADRSRVGEVVMSGPEGGELVLPESMPYITEEPQGDSVKSSRPYICNMRAGAVCGFKYLNFEGSEREIVLTVRGIGGIGICLDDPEGEILCSADSDRGDWNEIVLTIPEITGSHAVYFKIMSGTLDFSEFEFL